MGLLFYYSTGHPDLFCLVCFTFVFNVGLKVIIKNRHTLNSCVAVFQFSVERHSIQKCFQTQTLGINLFNYQLLLGVQG